MEMKSKTLELLDRALAQYKSERAMAAAFGFSHNVLHASRARGHLSPTLAGVIAEELGEDQMYWIAVAAVESERPSAQKDRLMRSSSNWRRR